MSDYGESSREEGDAEGIELSQERPDGYGYDPVGSSEYAVSDADVNDPKASDDDAWDEYLKSLSVEEVISLSWDESISDGLRRALERAFTFVTEQVE